MATDYRIRSLAIATRRHPLPKRRGNNNLGGNSVNDVQRRGEIEDELRRAGLPPKIVASALRKLPHNATIDDAAVRVQEIIEQRTHQQPTEAAFIKQIVAGYQSVYGGHKHEAHP